MSYYMKASIVDSEMMFALQDTVTGSAFDSFESVREKLRAMIAFVRESGTCTSVVRFEKPSEFPEGRVMHARQAFQVHIYVHIYGRGTKYGVFIAGLSEREMIELAGLVDEFATLVRLQQEAKAEQERKIQRDERRRKAMDPNYMAECMAEEPWNYYPEY